MAWSTIRKATNEDGERLNKAAERFLHSHPELAWAGGTSSNPIDAVEFGLEPLYGEDQTQREERVYLRKLWRAAVRRALHSKAAEGIGWDYVGFHVD